MTIIHEDLWSAKFVPSTYKRSELSNRVFCAFSSRKERICKWIPISNSLGEETALVNVSISKGRLKCQRVMLSDMPKWGDKVICKNTGCTLQKALWFYYISPLFSEISTLVVLECLSYSQFHRCSCMLHTNLNALLCTFSSSSWRSILEGSQTEPPYSRTGRTSPLYASSLTSCGHADKLRLRKPRVLFSFVQILLTFLFHFKSLVIVTPRYLIFSTLSRTVPSKL